VSDKDLTLSGIFVYWERSYNPNKFWKCQYVEASFAQWPFLAICLKFKSKLPNGSSIACQVLHRFIFLAFLFCFPQLSWFVLLKSLIFKKPQVNEHKLSTALHYYFSNGKTPEVILSSTNPLLGKCSDSIQSVYSWNKFIIDSFHTIVNLTREILLEPQWANGSQSLLVISTPCHQEKIVNGTGAVRDQKILVFVLQVEKSKQSTWMGWGRIAFWRKEELPILTGDEREEEEGGMVGTGGVCWQSKSAFLF
jgi:hypothetical protein